MTDFYIHDNPYQIIQLLSSSNVAPAVTITTTASSFPSTMDTELYQSGLKPVLLKNFKRVCNSVHPQNKELLSLFETHNDRYQLLEHLRDLEGVNIKQKIMVEKMLKDIEEAADGSQYFRGGATTVTITNGFAGLMRYMAANSVSEKAGITGEKIAKEKEWIIVEAAEEDDFVMV